MILSAVVLSVVTALVISTQALAFSTATIYNPLSLSNTMISNDRVNHAVTFFPGWTNRFAIDIRTANGVDMYPDREIYLWGAGWSTANVGTGSPGNNAHVQWTSYSDPSCTVVQLGWEYAVGYFLNLSNGQTAAFSISHLSNYHQGEGVQVSQGQQVANLSWHSGSGWSYAWIGGLCQPTATAPHVHVESARSGTTTFNDVDPGGSGAAGNPYWYYNFP
jgi:hypothetical protein